MTFLSTLTTTCMSDETSCQVVTTMRIRMQDFREEQRAKRRRLLSAAASACIRRGMIRYLQARSLYLVTALYVPRNLGCTPSSNGCVIFRIQTSHGHHQRFPWPLNLMPALHPPDGFMMLVPVM